MLSNEQAYFAEEVSGVDHDERKKEREVRRPLKMAKKVVVLLI